MTFGYITTKMSATAAAMATALRPNAQPSRPARVASTTPTSASAAITRGIHDRACAENASWAHTAQTAATSSETIESRCARRPARSRKSPSVLSARKTAPCVANRAAVVTPPSRVNGVRRDQNPPVSWCEPSMTSIFMPCTRLANATPHSTAGSQAPIVCAQSARSRHTAELILPRHSSAQIRTMSASRMRSSGR